MATAVLNTHFLLEAKINELLESVAKSPKFLQLESNIPFAQRVKWLRAFAPFGEDKSWELVLAINRLRNKVAHKFDGRERKKALQDLRNEFAPTLERSGLVSNVNEWPEIFVIQAAGRESYRFLSRIEHACSPKHSGGD